jgi:four helix bundle protein
MTEKQNTKQYDLEDRTFEFARKVRDLVGRLDKSIATVEDVKQLIRSSGSVGSNYIEANESLGKKDFLMRIRICRKEVKETGYWLRLLTLSNPQLEPMRNALVQEASELTSIFGAILRNSQKV